MGECPGKADGRRVFTPEFKRNVVQQIQKGEKALAEPRVRHLPDHHPDLEAAA